MLQAIRSLAVHMLLLLIPLAGASEPTSDDEDAVVAEALRVLPLAITNVRVLSALQVRQIYSRVAGTVPPAGLNAFRIQGDPNIYFNAESEVYRDAARAGTAFHLLRLAGTLLHEQVHETDGEYAARRLQADFVRSRLHGLPSSQRERANRYWRTLEGRAISLARAERPRRKGQL